jgi:hypothetical protein
MLGMAAALTAYLGQHLAKPTLGLNGPTLELLSLGLWAFATAAGIDRVRATVAALGAQSVEIEERERAGSLNSTLMTGGGKGAIDILSGRTFTPAEAQSAIDLSQKRAASASAQHAKWKRRGELSYNLRDMLLVLGVGVFLVAKLLEAAS